MLILNSSPCPSEQMRSSAGFHLSEMNGVERALSNELLKQPVNVSLNAPPPRFMFILLPAPRLSHQLLNPWQARPHLGRSEWFTGNSFKRDSGALGASLNPELGCKPHADLDVGVECRTNGRACERIHAFHCRRHQVLRYSPLPLRIKQAGPHFTGVRLGC